MGLMLVISGPAGSGKGTVLKDLFEDGCYAYSVSATTRAPRPGEVDGVNYHFTTREAFAAQVAAGEMLEHTEYNGAYYGTPRRAAEAVMASDKHLVLEIEVEGAANVKRLYPDAVLIMLLPPSFAAQEARLRGRATESEAQIRGRLETARREVPRFTEYDYVVWNADGETHRAADDIRAIVRAETLAARRNPDVAERYFKD